MQYFLATFILFLVVIAIMAVGYMFQRKTISGSCGGLASVGVDKECDCPEPCDKRKEREARAKAKAEMLDKHRIL